MHVYLLLVHVVWMIWDWELICQHGVSYAKFTKIF